MKILLDTDICVHIIRRKPPEVLRRFNEFQPGDIGASSITVAELMFGAHRSQRPEHNQSAVEQFLSPLVIADFDFGAAIEYGKLRAHLERQGMPIGAHDLLIAAHALRLGLPLATNNTREFSRVPGLHLENWTN